MTDTGPLAYLQELVALVNRHAEASDCPTPHLNKVIKDIMQNSYTTTFNHMVACEVSRSTGVSIGAESALSFSSGKLSMVIYTDNLRWSIAAPPGIIINLNKAMDEIASDASLEPHVVALAAMNGGTDDPDLVDYATTRINFLTQLFIVASEKMEQLEEIISGALAEEAANG